MASFVSCTLETDGEIQAITSVAQEGVDQDSDNNGSTNGGDSTSNPATTSTEVSSSAERETARLDYIENFVGSAVSDPEWSGSNSGCNAGSIPEAVNDKVIQRINYLRRLVGLNDNCTLDRSWNAAMQECVLVMDANNRISHSPSSSWSCYTSSAYTIAQKSNLSQGNHSVNAVMSQIRDRGNHNKAVGHRRWILFSRQLKYAHGSTDNFQALAVINLDFGNTNFPEYHAYPAEGFMPQNIVYDRWSFSIPGLGNDLQGSQISFQSASVEMTGPTGEEVSLNIIHREQTLADKTIVWEPQGIVRSGEGDKTYTITISGIQGAPSSSYTYTTTLFNPDVQYND
ncbi:MAG: hypothetical protein ACON42_04420 [Flavobacteriaceae bacterium]